MSHRIEAVTFTAGSFPVNIAALIKALPVITQGIDRALHTMLAEQRADFAAVNTVICGELSGTENRALSFGASTTLETVANPDAAIIDQTGAAIGGITHYYGLSVETTGQTGGGATITALLHAATWANMTAALNVKKLLTWASGIARADSDLLTLASTGGALNFALFCKR